MNGDERALVRPLTEAEREARMEAIQLKLYAFLAKRSERFTLNDSSSLPVELAEELFRGLCFVLGIGETLPDEAIETLAEADFDARFAMGVRRIKKQMALVQKLWRTAVLSLPAIPNTSLTDTLASIRAFQKRYDYLFFAHRVPADIDYQLCHPASEDLGGIDYLIAWLKNLLTESAFIGRFPVKNAIALLGKASPDYIGLHINLYEPIAAQAIGVTLAGGDATTLSLSKDEVKRIEETLNALPPAMRKARLTDAAQDLCRVFRMESQTSRDYLIRFAESLAPRIDAALEGGGLSGVFWA